MVKLASSLLAIAILSIPALALRSTEYSRGVAESDLYGRDLVPEDNILFTREDLNDIFNREFIDDLDVVLEARDPFLNSALKKKLLGSLHTALRAAAQRHLHRLANKVSHLTQGPVVRRRDFDDAKIFTRQYYHDDLD